MSRETLIPSLEKRWFSDIQPLVVVPSGGGVRRYHRLPRAAVLTDARVSDQCPRGLNFQYNQLLVIDRR